MLNEGHVQVHKNDFAQFFANLFYILINQLTLRRNIKPNLATGHNAIDLFNSQMGNTKII